MAEPVPAKPQAPKLKRRRAPAPRRSAARLAAVQALYQIDVAGVSAERVLDEFVRFRLESGRRVADQSIPDEGRADEGRADGADRAHFLDIVRGVSARTKAIDEILGGALTERWTVARLDPVLRAVIRAGVYEIFARDDIPPKVCISEYVDVAHAFFDGREASLVNGVLDRVARAFDKGAFEPLPPTEGDTANEDSGDESDGEKCDDGGNRADVGAAAAPTPPTDEP